MFNPVSKRRCKPFEFYENENGCFICTSHAMDWDGYPLIKRGGRMIRISRFVYTECFGAINDGYVIRHKCDNPNCINPEHLEEGTYSQNSMDMVLRGRQAKGEQNGASKLTDDDVRTIRRLRDNGTKYKEICQKYNISQTTVWTISKRKKWKHVD